MRKAPCLVALFVLTLTGLGDRPSAQTVAVKAQPGELVVDHPTLINLGFEWVIQGDDNRNAQIEVSYRKQGSTAWRQGLPLLRLQGERIYQTDGVFDVISPNMFAGLPNVTDGFGGQAPDLGAMESGQAPPHYGPRPL